MGAILMPATHVPRLPAGAPHGRDASCAVTGLGKANDSGFGWTPRSAGRGSLLPRSGHRVLKKSIAPMGHSYRRQPSIARSTRTKAPAHGCWRVEVVASRAISTGTIRAGRRLTGRGLRRRSAPWARCSWPTPRVTPRMASTGRSNPRAGGWRLSEAQIPRLHRGGIEANPEQPRASRPWGAPTRARAGPRLQPAKSIPRERLQSARR